MRGSEGRDEWSENRMLNWSLEGRPLLMTDDDGRWSPLFRLEPPMTVSPSIFPRAHWPFELCLSRVSSSSTDHWVVCTLVEFYWAICIFCADRSGLLLEDLFVYFHSFIYYYFSVSPKQRGTQLLKLASPPTFSHFQGCLFHLRSAQSSWLLKEPKAPCRCPHHGGVVAPAWGSCSVCWNKLGEEWRDGFFPN